MRKIDKLVLNAFWGPFVLTTLIVIFIFLLRLVLFYFADLFGKDLGVGVYIELFFYFSLITLPLALPLSVLLSSLMFFLIYIYFIKMKFEIINMKPLGDNYYFIIGKWFLKRTVGDLNGVYTLVFRKTKDGWKIISDHSS